MAFIKNNNPENPEVEWTVREDRLYFTKVKRDTAEIPNHKMINLTLGYATELNRIV